MKKIELLIIDPQNDFCDPSGSLFVPGADEDAKRLSNFIRRMKDKIYDIHVTLDSHHLVDIAHPIFWKNSEGKNPDPFTIITSKEIQNGTWGPTNPAFKEYVKSYIESLEANGRYPLCIWPPHCLIGSWGNNVVDPVYNAITEWENDFNMIDYVTKGSNYKTEHYSAVKSDVPDPEDPSTHLNVPLIQTLEEADIIVISGQALSHCVANTVTDIADNFGEDNIKKFVLLKDTCSNVPGFENLGDSFVKDMSARGMQVSTSIEFLK